eukprot:scaffold2716_cov205-Skeletonema_marinoi.AAC.9
MVGGGWRMADGVRGKVGFRPLSSCCEVFMVRRLLPDVNPKTPTMTTGETASGALGKDLFRKVEAA